MSNTIKIYEVSPRDGLQNEAQNVPSATKIELINHLSQTGLRHIEATSFVSPKAIPQLGDSAQVMAGITRAAGVNYCVLVPNMRGMEDAIAANIGEIAIFTAASNTFTQKNINATIDESFERFAPVIEAAKAHNIRVRGYVSCVAGCPYEGKIEPQKVAEITRRLIDAGCYEVSLGDTIGVGTPNTIEAMLKAVLETTAGENLALHMHDTYGQALANIYVGLKMGIRTIDSAVAGIGGCPYAKGASGNVATEDVLYMLDGMGYESGVNLGKIVETSWFIASALRREPNSKTAHALKNKN